MFTGEYFKKFIMNCIYINSIMIVMSLLSSIFVTKRFYLYGNLLPLPSLIISLLLVVGFYHFEKSRPLQVDFEGEEDLDDVLDNLSEVYGVPKESPSSLDLNKDDDSDSKYSPNLDIMSMEELELPIDTEEDLNKHFDKVSEEVLEKCNSNRKSEITERINKLKLNSSETCLHEPSTSIKQNFCDVKEQETAKINEIKENSNSDDDSFEFTNSVGNCIGMLRGNSNLRHSTNVDPVLSDEGLMTETTINDYDKNIIDRSKKKSMSLDSFIRNQNSAVIIEDVTDIDEDSSPSNSDEDSVNDVSPSNSDDSVLNTFNSHMNESDDDSNQTNDASEYSDSSVNVLNAAYGLANDYYGYGEHEEYNDPSFDYY